MLSIWATAPAKICGLFPQKGTLAIGSDADIVLFDPNASGTLSVSDSFHGVDYNSYEGMAFSGELRRVYLRGQLTFADGKFLGQEGQGKFISGQPFGLCYDEF